MSEIRMVVPDELDKFLESQVRTGTFSSKAELARAAITEYLESISTVSGGYDEETVFSPEGRVYQMEYAREAGYGGRTVIGIEGKDQVILAADVSTSELAREEDKIIEMENGLLATGSGLALDMVMAMKELENYKIEDYKDLKYALADIYQEYSLSKKVRPLGAVLLIGARFNDEPYLIEVDSSGKARRMKAAALGEGEREVKEELTEKYEEGMATEQCEELCQELLEDSTAVQIEKL